MGTLSIQDGQGGWIPLAGPAVDGEGPVGNAVRMRRLAAAGIPSDILPKSFSANVTPAEGETAAEAAERMARLRAAKQREAKRFECPRCGTPNAKWAHEDFPRLCKPRPVPEPGCPECGAAFRIVVPKTCPLCGADIYVTGRD